MDPFPLDSANRRSGSRHRFSRSVRMWTATTISALAAPFADATLSGSRLIDWLWAAGLAALAALVATRSRRNWVLAASIIAALTARTWPSVIAAAVAVAFSVHATRRLERRAVFSRALGGGATVVTLLLAGGEIPAVQIAVASVAVAVVLGVSAWRRSSPETRRRALIALGGLAFAWTAATAAAAVGLLANATRLDNGSSHLKLGLSAARLGDVEQANAHFEAAGVAIRKARSDLDRYGWAAEAFPVVGQQVRATTDVLARIEVATGEARRAAGLVVGEGLAVRAGRIDLDAVAGLATPLARLARALDEVVAEVDEHRSGPLLTPLRDRLDELRDVSHRAGRDAKLGAQAAEALPDALGSGEARRYLVVFTSPAEARGRLGFPSSFAEVTFDDGRFQLGERGSTSQLLGTVTFEQDAFAVGDPAVRPYAPFGVTSQFLSTTIPPDFTVVAGIMAEMWEQTGRAPLDGVIRMDPAGLAPLLRFTGPVSVDGGPTLDATTVEEYLLVQQYLDFPNATAPRREVLDEVAEITFERLETASLPNPRALVDLFAPVVAEDHLMVSSFLPPAAALFREIDLDGAFPAPASDGLLVSTVNQLGNKIDSFLSMAVSYSGTIQGTEATTRLRVELRNGAPPSGLADYVIGAFGQPGLPKGTNRSAILVHTALPAVGAQLDGSPVQPVSTLTVGRWFHRVEVEVPPGGTVALELELAGTLPDGAYELVLEPSGGAQPTIATVAVNADGGQIAYTGPIRTPIRLAR